jgi:hypothetical protein
MTLRSFPENAATETGVQPAGPDKSQVRQWLERAAALAARGDERGALAILDALVGAVVFRRDALRLWLDLVGRVSPGELARARSEAVRWAREALASLKRGVGARQGGGAEQGVVSRTLARLYWEQGHRGRALELYRILLDRHPGDEDLRREFEGRLAAEAPGRGDSRHLHVLEAWADRIRRHRQGGKVAPDEGKG